MSSIAMPPEAAAMPDPGDELITRVAGAPSREWFFWSGRQSVRDTERTLSLAGRTLDSFEAILDFGCGCGRMLLWLEELARDRRIVGSDVDAQAIAWVGENLPYCEAVVNSAAPPLPFADGEFDLVYSHSVFTHIDEARQDVWLTELRRVVRPGGLLVLSTHGEVALEEGGFDIRDQLERDGIVFIDKLHPPDFALPDWYQVTYHAPWYVFEHWGRWFRLRGYVPAAALGLQDHVLLERVDEPLRPLRVDRAPAGVASAAWVADTRRRAAAMPSRFGPLGRLGRRLALRAMRPYSAHAERIDATLATQLGELIARVERLERRADPAEPPGP